jgi:hypothetical protein
LSLPVSECRVVSELGFSNPKVEQLSGLPDADNAGSGGKTEPKGVISN